MGMLNAMGTKDKNLIHMLSQIQRISFFTYIYDYG